MPVSYHLMFYTCIWPPHVLYLYLTTSHLGVMRKGGQKLSMTVWEVSMRGSPLATASYGGRWLSAWWTVTTVLLVRMMVDKNGGVPSPGCTGPPGYVRPRRWEWLRSNHSYTRNDLRETLTVVVIGIYSIRWYRVIMLGRNGWNEWLVVMFVRMAYRNDW
jgi:hypothetical protein